MVFNLDPKEENNKSDIMAGVLEAMEDFKPLKRGQIISGTVVTMTDEGALVNVGHKSEGLIPRNEMRTIEDQDVLDDGNTVTVMVIRGESYDSPAVLSLDKMSHQRGWKRLVEAQIAQERIKGRIVGVNKGGFLVDTENIQGFVPLSQIVTLTKEQMQKLRKGEWNHNDAATELVGKELELVVMDADHVRSRVIMSEREADRQVQDERRTKIVETLTEGQTITGKVTRISEYGAFIDMGGLAGLLHISEMAWVPVREITDLVTVGQVVTVYILGVDKENKRVSLSLKRLSEEPWEKINEKYKVGDVVDAEITKITDFGAFARLDGMIEGLIHISELSNENVRDVTDIVNSGDKVKVKILSIEFERRRLGLSFKDAKLADDVSHIEGVEVNSSD